ncbi:hypothetical protein DERF_009544 [Dermatophagoides farinae]|uniref:Uncharacterized protein n=1 Tax=Dermatophagoides farinae TaxID=6954 RepID=A0A922HY67_DERFA|nr:hypothetical protein DERF_009544 [Dermatophagoides farinae]
MDDYNTFWIVRYWLHKLTIEIELFHHDYINNSRTGYICMDNENEIIRLSDQYCEHSLFPESSQYLWPPFDFGFIRGQMLYLVFTAKSIILTTPKTFIDSKKNQNPIKLLSIDYIFQCHIDATQQQQQQQQTTEQMTTKKIINQNDQLSSLLSSISSLPPLLSSLGTPTMDVNEQQQQQQKQTRGKPRPLVTTLPPPLQMDKNNENIRYGMMNIVRWNKYLILIIVGKYSMIAFYLLLDHLL